MALTCIGHGPVDVRPAHTHNGIDTCHTLNKIIVSYKHNKRDTMSTHVDSYKTWTPKQDPHGIVQIITNNHNNDYEEFAGLLTDNGYIVVCAPDMPPILKHNQQLPVFLIRHDDGRKPWPNTDKYTACVAIKKQPEHKNPLAKMWDFLTVGAYDCPRPDKPCLVISNGADIFKIATSASRSLYQNFKDYNINHLTVVVYPYANNDMMQDENWPNAQHEILRFVNRMRTI